jgi:hypothetical protein
MLDPIDHTVWEDEYEDSLHPVSGRNRVLSVVSSDGSKPPVFRAYSDEAIDVALSIAEIAENRMSALNAQQLGVLTVQLTLCGAVMIFCFQVLKNGSMTGLQLSALAGFALIQGAVFLIASWRNSTAYHYYAAQSSTARFLARHHHRIKQIHIQADRTYQAKIKRFPRMLDVHSVQWVTWTSAVLTMGTLAVVLAKYFRLFEAV